MPSDKSRLDKLRARPWNSYFSAGNFRIESPFEEGFIPSVCGLVFVVSLKS
jgi:hypothetical protein